MFCIVHYLTDDLIISYTMLYMNINTGTVKFVAIYTMQSWQETRHANLQNVLAKYLIRIEI